MSTKPTYRRARFSQNYVKLLPVEERAETLYPKDGALTGQRHRALALAYKLLVYPEALGGGVTRDQAMMAIYMTLDGDVTGEIRDGGSYQRPEVIIDRLLSYWDYNYGEDLGDVVDAYPTGGDDAAFRGWAARARDAAMAAIDKGAA